MKAINHWGGSLVFTEAEKGIARGKLGQIRKLAVPAAFAFHIGATTLIYFAAKFESLSQPFPDAATYQNQMDNHARHTNHVKASEVLKIKRLDILVYDSNVMPGGNQRSHADEGAIGH